MITFKCKMCGGDLSFEPGASVAECPYCGTTQTLPKLDDDRRANLYDRANHFRRQNEYDKAMAIYEQILAEDRTDAEAYWSLVLCRYGIEYVEDPTSHKRVPTVNRAQYASILADEDYKSALNYADTLQRGVYEAEANAIAEIQKGILDISKKEEPFDVFICYKETDANGRRTPDSVLATDLYHQLTKEGFKVFFSRITLEDKIGTAYEPYIFAALNSAKVMVVLGTKPEYFNAVWVKNEWSRYLALIKNDADKVLVPAYRDMDPYDLPEEFAHLQAQDMGKLGFMQDLIRGIKKLTAKEAPRPQTVVQQTVTALANNVAPLLERAFIFLEDGDWSSADEYAEKVLDLDPKNGRAYLVKLMAQLKVRREEDLKNQPQPFGSYNNYQKVMRFGDDALKAQLHGDIEQIDTRIRHNQQKTVYDRALKILVNANDVNLCKEAKRQFQSIPDYEGVQRQIVACDEKIERIDAANYQKAATLQAGGKWQQAIEGYNALNGYRDSRERIAECEEAIREDTYKRAEAFKNDQKWREAITAFEKLGGYRDSRKQVELCREAQEAERRETAERLEREWREEESKAKKEVTKRRTLTIVALLLAFAIAAGAYAYFRIIKPNGIYSSAIKVLEAGNYDEARSMFTSLGNYKDAATKAEECLPLCRNKNVTYAVKISTGYDYTVGLKSDGTVVAAGWNKYSQCDTSTWTDIVSVATRYDHTVGLKSDGTVVAVGHNTEGQCDTGAWTDIVAVTTGKYHTAGLRSDGTVIAVGWNKYNQCHTDTWTDIVSVVAGGDNTVGLKLDGTVVAVGNNYSRKCDTGAWNDVVAIAVGSDHTVGLKSDGTVVAVGDNSFGQCDTGTWTDIVAIAAGNNHTVGLKSDGTVVAVGDDDDCRCDTGTWTDIVAIAAGEWHTVGLKLDGTVVAVGDNYFGQCDTGAWTDIVAVAAGNKHTVGLKLDGTVVAVGSNGGGQCDTGDWKLWD